FSINTTGTPNAAAAATTDKPPEPAPITHRSGVRISGTSGIHRPPRAPASNENGDQRDHAEPRERRQKLGRERGRHVEIQVEVRAAFGQAGAKRRAVGAN